MSGSFCFLLPRFCFVSSSLRQRIATEFTIISHEDVPVGKGGGGPDEFLLKQRRRGVDQMSPPKFCISGGRWPRPNQVALIGKKKQRRPIGRQVNTGPLPQFSDGVGLPPFVPRRGIKADKQSSGSWAVNRVIHKQWSGGVAQNAAGARGRVGPENFCGRLGLVE